MRLTEIVHQQLSEHLQRGDRAIDATAGNGYDTVYLAKRVGMEGHVVAIDLQYSALEATRRQLNYAGLKDRCQLLVGDHAELLAQIEGEFAAVIFNLGYLPGGDKTIRTGADSTVQALNHCKRLLQSGGLLCVTAYRGHPGGLAEADAVENWMREREQSGWSIASVEPEATKSGQPPILWLATKKS